jgi:hypothetical protein
MNIVLISISIVGVSVQELEKLMADKELSNGGRIIDGLQEMTPSRWLVAGLDLEVKQYAPLPF